MIQDEMRQTPLPGGTEPAGVHWNIQAGFHALPSMAHLHLHVSCCVASSGCAAGSATDAHMHTHRS